LGEWSLVRTEARRECKKIKSEKRDVEGFFFETKRRGVSVRVVWSNNLS
jgi:hypothetical protein